MAITRKELAAILSEKTSFSVGESAEFLEMVFEILIETLEKGERIKISRFGNFAVREKRARRGRNSDQGRVTDRRTPGSDLQAQPCTAESLEQGRVVAKAERIDLPQKILDTCAELDFLYKLEGGS